MGISATAHPFVGVASGNGGKKCGVLVYQWDKFIILAKYVVIDW